MNYSKHYNLLIERAQLRTLPKNTYIEKHHIIPKSLGGNNHKTNIVYLLPEEHLVAHLLLVKIYPDSKAMLYAANIMSSSNGNINQKRNNNKRYGWLKKQYAAMRHFSMIGENNHRFGTIMSSETKEKISRSNTGNTSFWKGKNLTEEMKIKLSVTRKDKGLSKGILNPMFGKKHIDLTKQKMSMNRSGKALGSSNGMFGKTHTDEIKLKLRNKNLKMWKITDIVIGVEWIGKDIDIFCQNNGLIKSSLQDVARARKKNPHFNYTYKKRWICEFYEQSSQDTTHAQPENTMDADVIDAEID